MIRYTEADLRLLDELVTLEADGDMGAANVLNGLRNIARDRTNTLLMAENLDRAAEWLRGRKVAGS